MGKFRGTLYLMRSGSTILDEPGDAVVEEFEGARSLINLAAELWRIAEDEPRARAIDDFLDRVYSSKPYAIKHAQIAELLALTDGLTETLLERVVDTEWKVPADRIPELRQRAKLLDFDPKRGELARSAVAEGIGGLIRCVTFCAVHWMRSSTSRSADDAPSASDAVFGATDNDAQTHSRPRP